MRRCIVPKQIELPRIFYQQTWLTSIRPYQTSAGHFGYKETYFSFCSQSVDNVKSEK